MAPKTRRASAMRSYTLKKNTPILRRKRKARKRR